MPFNETRSLPNLGDSANPAVEVGDPRKASDMREAVRLRELAAWYREFMKRAGNPTIWESRLRMAEELDKEADRLEPEYLDRPLTIAAAPSEPRRLDPRTRIDRKSTRL